MNVVGLSIPFDQLGFQILTDLSEHGFEPLNSISIKDVLTVLGGQRPNEHVPNIAGNRH